MNRKTTAQQVNAQHSVGRSAEANREELIVSNLPLVQMIAKHLALRLPPCVTFDELISAGSIGLIKAAARFDPNLGWQFPTYAKHRIRGEMLDFLREQDPLSRLQRRVRREIGGNVETALTDAVVLATDCTPTDPLLRAQVSKARQALSRKENRVVELFFYAGWNNREIAQELGVHESRVSQLRTRALSKLRAQLACTGEAA